MSENLSHYIPRSLDDPPKFLFWDVDVVAFAMMGILFGILSSHEVIGMGAGVWMAYRWTKFKSGSHPGYANHLLYWAIGFPGPTELPPSYFRELNG